MVKLVLILMVAMLFEAIGVVLLSQGLKEVGDLKHLNPGEIFRAVGRGCGNRNILLGVLFEAIFFFTLLVLLKHWDVSLIWPLTSLGFVLTTLAAKYLRHEDVSALRWGGVLLIMAGAAIVGWSEKAKAPAPVIPATGTPLK